MATNDFKITIENQKDSEITMVTISGDLSIDNTLSIRNQLLNNALDQEIISVIISDSSNIDLSMIQLMIGYIDSRNKANKNTTIEFNIDESDFTLLKKTGAIELMTSSQ